jgi:hypothetical protein
MASPFTIGTRVRASKLSEQNAGLLPTGYHLWGALMTAPTIGKPLLIARSVRSRQQPEEPEIVERPGVYESSAIQQLIPQDDGGLVVVTMNSHWRLDLSAEHPAASVRA